MAKILKTEEEFNRFYKSFCLNYDFSTPEKQKHTITEKMNNCMFQTVSGATNKVVNNEDGDFTATKKRRRIEALNNQIDNLIEHLDIQETKNINKKSLLLLLNSLILKPYDFWDRQINVMLACAIWILDTIKENGKYDELTVLLEDLDTSKEAVKWRDSVHDTDLVLKVLHVLNNRNKDICNDNNKWMDTATEKKIQHQNVPSRNRYEALINLCGEENIKEAVEKYKTKYNETLKLYSEFSKRTIKSYNNELIALSNAWDNYNNKAKIFDSIDWKRNAISMIKDAIYTSATPISILNEQMDTTSLCIQAIVTRADMLGLVGNMDKDEAEKTFGLDDLNLTAFEDYNPLSIENPYELAFATLYLIDSDNDLPWCYFPGVVLFAMIALSLPWRQEASYKTLENNEEFEAYNETANIYKPIYSCYVEGEMPASEAQLMYNVTRVIPPRKTELNRETINTPFEISDKDHTVLSYLKGYTEKHFEGTKLPGDNEEILNKENVLLQNKNNELNRINKELQTSQNQLVSSQEKLLKEKEELEKEIASQNKELSELRKIIFEIETHKEIEEDQTIQYPYSFDKKIVVYGGHDKWLKHMNNLTEGNIEIVGPDVKIDKKLIQNADLLVIQINCISHPYYWRAIDAAKLGNTQILLLYQDSPRICVQQIIEKVRKEEEK